MTLPLFNVGGLASGLDTAAIIDATIAVERIPIDQLNARKETFEAKDAAWQEINTRISAVRTALNAVDSVFDFNKLVTAATSDEAAVSVAATGSANPGSLSFTVDQLAATHQVAATTNFTGGSDVVGAGTFTITIGTTATVATATASTTLSDLAQQINSLGIAVSASVLSIDGTDHRLVLTATDEGAAGTFTTSSTIASLAATSVIQQGTDAIVTVGSGPGALALTRSSNTITDLVPGATVGLKQVSVAPVTVTVNRDIDAATEAIKTLMVEVNATLTTIADHTRYDVESETGGPLLGERTARSLALDLRSAISGTVNAGSTTYPLAASIGISLNSDGTFDVDETKLRAAFEADFDEVLDLVLDSATALDSRLSFVSALPSTVQGSYAVVATQAATKATALSATYNTPTNDTTFQIVVGSTSVNVTVLQNDLIAASLAAINTALTAASVSSVTAVQVTVNGDDFIQLDHSGFGSGATFTVAGDPFGLAGTYAGTDVAGTIGGQAATGAGQVLTGDTGDPSGLAVKITATQAEVDGAGGSLALGTVDFAGGVFGAVDREVDLAEGAAGKIARARDLWKAQIGLIDDRIDVLEDRIERRKVVLARKFAALETLMSRLSTQGALLTAQITALNASRPNNSNNS